VLAGYEKPHGLARAAAPPAAGVGDHGGAPLPKPRPVSDKVAALTASVWAAILHRTPDGTRRREPTASPGAQRISGGCRAREIGSRVRHLNLARERVPRGLRVDLADVREVPASRPSPLEGVLALSWRARLTAEGRVARLGVP
jgi:hypothetical protein